MISSTRDNSSSKAVAVTAAWTMSKHYKLVTVSTCAPDRILRLPGDRRITLCELRVRGDKLQ